MSIKIDMTSNDIDRQIALLKYFPEVMEKHFRPALESSTQLLEDKIRPNIPTLTSKAQDTFGSRIIDTRTRLSGFVDFLSGQVGWWGKKMPWYINVVEYGAKPHPLNKGSNIRSKYDEAAFKLSTRSQKGTHVNIGGRWVTMGVHPGLSARGFMAAGYSAVQPIVDAELSMASENVLREMAAK